MKTSYTSIYAALFLNKDQISLLKESKIPESLLDRYAKKLTGLFPDIQLISNYPVSLKHIPLKEVIEESSELNFLRKASETLPPSSLNDPDIDEVFLVYFTGIYPLLSKPVTDKIIDRHIKYLSQYSYSENLPKGIVPHILSREFIQSLPDNLSTSAHDYLLKNINNYDTEIHYEAPDLRQYRLDFSLSDLRSIHLSSQIISLHYREYSELQSILLGHPDLLRPAPSYIEIELYRGCELKCSFCPRQFIQNERDGIGFNKESLFKFYSDFEHTFNLPYTICFGGMGEPLLHPDLFSILDKTLSLQNLKELIVETSLYPDIDSLVEFLKTLDSGKKSKLGLIINLTTLNNAKYKEIYGTDKTVNSVLEKIDSLSGILGNANIHVQILKIKEVETEIEEYFNYFEKKNIDIVLQKYNRFAQLMPEKRVSDLTPIKREFCWHLSRDLYINFDGSVSICRQDFRKSIGNIAEETIPQIWEKGLNAFGLSLNNKHDSINAPCLNCDEWYTFNA